MDMGWMVPVGIVAAISASHAFRTWVRAKHGYPLEDENRKRGRSYRGESPAAERKIELLSSENERLTGQIGRLEERLRSEEHTSELESLMRTSYAVFCLKKKKTYTTTPTKQTNKNIEYRMKEKQTP